MTSKQRSDRRNQAAGQGLAKSASDSRKQLDKKGNIVIHIDTNRTKVNEKLYYGSHAANVAIGKLND